MVGEDEGLDAVSAGDGEDVVDQRAADALTLEFGCDLDLVDEDLGFGPTKAVDAVGVEEAGQLTRDFGDD